MKTLVVWLVILIAAKGNASVKRMAKINDDGGTGCAYKGYFGGASTAQLGDQHLKTSYLQTDVLNCIWTKEQTAIAFGARGATGANAIFSWIRTMFAITQIFFDSRSIQGANNRLSNETSREK